MEYLFIYALQMADTLDAIKWIAFTTLIVSVILSIGFCIDDYIPKILKTNTKNVLIASLIIILLAVILPTKQTLILWGGTYYGKQTINQVVNSEKYKKISELIDLKLDNLIKEEKVSKHEKSLY